MEGAEDKGSLERCRAETREGTGNGIPSNTEILEGFSVDPSRLFAERE